MEKQEFTYSISPKSYHGWLNIYKGKHQTQYPEEILDLYTVEDLVEALKKYPNTVDAILVWDDSLEIIEEGERLSKKLGLEFQHP